MKRPFQTVLVFVLISTFCLENVIACTVDIQPLRKEFKKANSVFIGKVLKVEEYDPNESEKKSISENWQDWEVFSKVTVEIKKKWKGSLSKSKTFLSVAFFDCGCPEGRIDEFVIGKEYLIFSEKSGFITICDSKLASNDWTKKDMKRLDSFGFRLWARIYPF